MVKPRNLKKRIIGIMLAACLASVIFAVPAYAAGGAYVDSYVEVAEGEHKTIYVSADNAFGVYSVSSSGNVHATMLDEGALDNDSEAIDIFGASAGDGTVTIYFSTLATFDEEELDGTTLYVNVHVYSPDGGYTPDKGGEDGGQPAEQETTTADPNVDKLKVALDGAEYSVLKDLAGIELPKGFTEADGTYNGEKVRVLSFGKDLTLYVLKKTDDGSIIFRTYNEKDKKFEAPKTLVQNKITYYLLDIPEGEKAPEGYTEKDLKIGDYTVKGYVANSKTYEDFYYIRALSDGTAGYYAYDTKQGSIQRCMSLDEALNANELIKQMQEEAEKEALKAAKTEKMLKILLLVAAVIVVGLIVALIIVAAKKKKNGGSGPGNSNGPKADDLDTERLDVSDELTNEFNETAPLDEVEVPDGVSDLDAYEMEIEDLIDDEAGTSWKDLGM
ncbi:MAG: hypothetical protein IKG00_07850 [Lachnospiraceae bacterium]|nr:hypothetical protein [Lachnospiraceae bacterium]